MMWFAVYNGFAQITAPSASNGGYNRLIVRYVSLLVVVTMTSWSPYRCRGHNDQV